MPALVYTGFRSLGLRSRGLVDLEDEEEEAVSVSLPVEIEVEDVRSDPELALLPEPYLSISSANSLL